MYTAKSVDKSVKEGALHITVEYTDDSGKPTFQETYWANSGVDPYWLQNRVNNKLHEVNTLMVLHDEFTLGDIPKGHGMPPPTEINLYVQDVQKLRSLQNAVELGLLTEKDPAFVAQTEKVKKGFKKDYLDSIRF